MNLDGVESGSDETGLEWIQVCLYQNGKMLQIVKTDESGNYQFSGLMAGEYNVYFGIPDGNLCSIATTRWQHIVLQAGQTAINTDIGCVAPCEAPNEGEAPVKPAPTGVKFGIDWSTLKGLRKSVKSVVGGVEGQAWSVKLTDGTVVEIVQNYTVYEQPAGVFANVISKDIRYNCHGYSLGGTGIICPDGLKRDFTIDTPSAWTILNACYTDSNLADTKTAFSNNKHVVFEWKNGNSVAVHTVVPTTIRIYDSLSGAALAGRLDRSSRCNTKNGWNTFQEDVWITDVDDVYVKTKMADERLRYWVEK